MTDYEITGPTKVCALSGQELKPGDRIYGALVEENGKFARKDYAAAAWVGPPPGAVAYWAGRVPAADKPRKPVINDDLLVECINRLKGPAAGATGDGLNFRYVAALLLMRRKRFRFEDVIRDEAGRDVMLLRDARGGAVHQIVDPRLTDEQIADVQAEVFRALGWE